MPGCDEATSTRLVPLHLCRTAGRALPRAWAVPPGAGVCQQLPRRHVEPGVPPGLRARPPPARLGLRTLLRRRPPPPPDLPPDPPPPRPPPPRPLPASLRP